MKKFTNPLDKIKIASPCSADWNEMQGDARKRYCSDCKLNVYNLSEMTRADAENFIINTEGRACVRFYRRADGTVLTNDCPVGWQAFKKKTSRVAKAFISVCAGLFGGIFAFNQLQPDQNFQAPNSTKISAVNPNEKLNPIEDFKNEPASSEIDGNYKATMGMLIMDVEKPNKKAVSAKKNRR